MLTYFAEARAPPRSPLGPRGRSPVPRAPGGAAAALADGKAMRPILMKGHERPLTFVKYNVSSMQKKSTLQRSRRKGKT